MSPSCSIKGIIFDFGGVLAEEEARNQLLLTFDRQLDLPPGTIRHTLYSGDNWEAASTGKITHREHWEATPAPHWAEQLPPEFAHLQEDNFYGQPLDEKMVQIVIKMSQHHKIALCSNAFPSLLRHLQERPELFAAFDAIIISALVGMRKPDPAIYRLTAKQLQLAPENCLLIDDQARNTEVAAQIGMQTLRFDDREKTVKRLHQMGLL